MNYGSFDVFWLLCVVWCGVVWCDVCVCVCVCTCVLLNITKKSVVLIATPDKFTCFNMFYIPRLPLLSAKPERNINILLQSSC